MADSVNKATILGNVGKDPEIRSAQSGRKIANFTVATSESWTDKASGEKREQTEWHRIVVMNDNLAAIVEKYVRKGSKIYVEGKVQTRKWTDQGGTERYTTEIVVGLFNGSIVLLSHADDAGGGQTASRAGAAPAARSKAAPAAGGWSDQAQGWDGLGSDLDDEIPF